MAKIDLKFLDFEEDENYIQAAKSSISKGDVIRIHLEMGGQNNIIDLDKSTAIKFAKTLRTEINKIGGLNV